MIVNALFLLFFAICSAKSIKSVDSPDVFTAAFFQTQEHFNRELLRKIRLLELQQKEDRENILSLKAENEKLKEIVNANQVTSDDPEIIEDIGTLDLNDKNKRGNKYL